jgi:pimeloyl-ACP methyl ester carboxylesterase
MGLRVYSVLGTPMAVRHIGNASSARWHLVWGHGWGQSSTALIHMAESLAPVAYSSLIDFPGFGGSPPPPEVWGTASYAAAVAEYLGAAESRECIWIGYSFGCRVGLRLASGHPQLIRGMVLIAAAGLPAQRGFAKKLQIYFQTRFLRSAKHIVTQEQLEYLIGLFGSHDYASAGPLRPILTRVANEDLAEVARKVECPTLLIYGRGDTETPVETGERFARLIRGSQLVILENYDHNTIISDGSHQITNLIRQFLTKADR